MSDGLRVTGLSLRLGDFALHGIDLAVGNGEILAVLGPNGAGKSVTLETIAGFHRPPAGRIEIAGGDVTGLPPERRRIGLVLQDYGLFPHLTVAANVALPYLATPEAPREVAVLLERFGIARLAARRPRELSPGERQRTALARALAARPRLFLFDEPFAAVDAPTREALRDELRAFLRGSGVPAVFVTHDLAEAMGMADRLAVMRAGRILQQGAAPDVYRAPTDEVVAGIVGVDNILPGRVLGRDGGEWRVAVGPVALRAAAGDGGGWREAATIAVRAEEVALLTPARDGGDAGGNRLPATVRAVADTGALVKVSLDCGFPLVARLTGRDARRLGLSPGQALVAEIAPAAVRVLRARDQSAAAGR